MGKTRATRCVPSRPFRAQTSSKLLAPSTSASSTTSETGAISRVVKSRAPGMKTDRAVDGPYDDWTKYAQSRYATPATTIKITTNEKNAHPSRGREFLARSNSSADIAVEPISHVVGARSDLRAAPSAGGIESTAPELPA